MHSCFRLLYNMTFKPVFRWRLGFDSVVHAVHYYKHATNMYITLLSCRIPYRCTSGIFNATWQTPWYNLAILSWVKYGTNHITSVQIILLTSSQWLCWTLYTETRSPINTENPQHSLVLWQNYCASVRHWQGPSAFHIPSCQDHWCPHISYYIILQS